MVGCDVVWVEVVGYVPARARADETPGSLDVTGRHGTCSCMPKLKFRRVLLISKIKDNLIGIQR